MPLKITSEDLIKLTNSFTYKKYGDSYEVAHGDSLIENFDNSEIFWRKFVTPITNRIDNSVSDVDKKIRPRENISLDLQELCSFHYSVFLNLAYAEECLNKKHFSYFENFYTHLGSTCDLAEEFLTQLYFISLECEVKKTEVLQNLSEDKFLDIAREWYNRYYENTFKFYLSKGKMAPIKLISRSNILDEYFLKSHEWKDYSKTACEIRTYRNAVVHNTQIANITNNNQAYVPKRQKISEYKKWHQVFSVKPERFKHDFIEKNLQMRNDITELKDKLNLLWEKPLEHFNTLLYVNQNDKLLKKYNILLLQSKNGL